MRMWEASWVKVITSDFVVRAKGRSEEQTADGGMRKWENDAGLHKSRLQEQKEIGSSGFFKGMIIAKSKLS